MRENLRPVAIALLCVLAIGLAAATLGSPVDPGSDGGGEPSEVTDTNQEREGPGEINDLPEVNSTSQSDGSGNRWEYCYEPLEGQPLMALLVVFTLGIGAVVGAVTTKERGAAAVLVAFWPGLIALLLLTSGCERELPSQEEGVELMARAANETQEAGGETARQLTTPTSLIAILLVVAMIGVVAAVYFRNPDEEDEPPMPEDPTMDDEQRQAAIGTAAGDAADRIEEDAALENEVYRAWAEMAEPLPVDSPETSSPAEFAEAAIDSGIAPDDVRELTDLFEEVRYGTAAATEERERRAVDALRRIERTYADSDVGDGGPEWGDDGA